MRPLADVQRGFGFFLTTRCCKVLSAHGGAERADKPILLFDGRREIVREFPCKHLREAERVVEQAQSVLINEQDEVRNRGITLLNEVISASVILLLLTPPPHPSPPSPSSAVADPQSLTSLVHFYGDRLQDEPCVKEVLRGLRILLDSLDAPPTGDLSRAATHAVVSVLKFVHVQSLALSDRHNAYVLVEMALDKLQLPLFEQHDDVLGCWVQCMNGERDPRNLLLCFRLIPRIAAACLKHKDSAEDLFNVFSCYFPITFTPPPDDKVGISADMLREALLECLTCHFLLVPLSMDLALSKLAEAESTSCRLDSLDVLATLASRHGVQGSFGHDGSQQIWSSLRLQIVDSGEQEVQERARSCLRHILRIAAEELGDQSEQGGIESSCLHGIMKTLKMQTAVDLKTPQELRSRKGLSTVLCAVSAHPLSATFVLHDSLYALRDIVLASGGESGFACMYASLQVIHEILLSARSLWMYMKGRSAGMKHPLSEFAKDIFDTLTSVFVLDSFAGEESSKLKQTSLQSICELMPVVESRGDVKRAFDMLVGEFVAQTRNADERVSLTRTQISSCLSMMQAEGHPSAKEVLKDFTALCLSEEDLWASSLEVLRTSFSENVEVAKTALDIFLEALRVNGTSSRPGLVFVGLFSVIDSVKSKFTNMSSESAADEALTASCKSVGSMFATKIVPEILAGLSFDDLNSSPFAQCLDPLAGMIRATLQLVGEGEGSREFVSLLLDKCSAPGGSSSFSNEQLRILQSVFTSALPSDLRSLDASKQGCVTKLAARLLEGFEFSQEDQDDCRKSVLAGMMNKFDGDAFESMYQLLVDQTLLPKVSEQKFASTVNRFLAWIAKALVCRGHPKGQVIMQIFREYLMHIDQVLSPTPVVSSCSLLGLQARFGVTGYEVLGSRDLDKDFSKQNHFVCKPLWRQRFFSQVSARCSQTRRGNSCGRNFSSLRMDTPGPRRSQRHS
eukprot:745964-Hanusia_phi.AAC.1